MSPLLFIVFFIAIVAAILAGIHFDRKERLRRNGMLLQVLAPMGLRLSDWEHREEDWPLFENAVQLKKGHSRYAYNVGTGRHAGHEVTTFDYHYAVTSSNGKSTTTRHYHLSCAAVSLDRRYPVLTVFPEGFGSKIAQFFGYDDIDFESKAFSDAYCVRCEDKRFAYDVITPGMMEYLLSREGLHFEITGKTLLVTHDRLIDPQELPALLNRAVKIRNRIPGHVMPAPIR